MTNLAETIPTPNSEKSAPTFSGTEMFSGNKEKGPEPIPFPPENQDAVGFLAITDKNDWRENENRSYALGKIFSEEPLGRLISKSPQQGCLHMVKKIPRKATQLGRIEGLLDGRLLLHSTWVQSASMSRN